MAIKSDAQRRAVAKYNEKKYDRIELRVKKGDREKIQVRATANGESLNGYINRLIKEDMNK